MICKTLLQTPERENLGLGQAEGTADAKAETKPVQENDDALLEDLLVAEDLLDTDRKYLNCEARPNFDVLTTARSRLCRLYKYILLFNTLHSRDVSLFGSKGRLMDCSPEKISS